MAVIFREKEKGLFLLALSTFIFFFVAFPLFDIFVLGTEITTSSVITDKRAFASKTVMSASPAAAVHVPKKSVVFFEIDGSTCRIRVPEKQYRDFEKGQPISVTYRKGMLTGTFLTLLVSCD